MRKRESLRLFVLIGGLMGLLGACGADHGSGGGGGTGAVGGAGAGSGTDGGIGDGGGVLEGIPGLKSIRVDPPTASVTVEKGTPATVQFKAFGTFDGKPEREITTEVSWRSDDPGHADVDQKGLATTAPNVGGLATITATSGFIRGQAKLTIKYSEVMLDTTVTTPVPAEAPTKFTAAPLDAARAPVLVYPASGVLLPPNLAGIEIHFTPTVDTNKLFELQFTSPYLDLRVYTRCQAPAGITGCIYAPSQDAWRVLAAANRGGGDVKVVVRGMDEAGTGKGESSAITMGFSRDEILGAVYYWSTKEKAVKRWDFGSTKQKTAETIVEGSTFGGTCPGCHALARDGGKLVLSTNGQNDGRLLLFDLKTNKASVPYPLKQRSQFEAWNPTGSQFVGIFGDESDMSKNPGYGSLMFFDGATGAVQTMVKPTPYLPDHPDWSPDGNRIVFTTVGQHKTDQQSYKGGLAYVTSEGAGWSAAKELLPPVAGKSRYYPAISPTNDFIAFNESTCPAGKDVDDDCNFDMDTTSKLWGLFLQGNGAMPVEFANANKPGVADAGKTAITNSYPKWSPFVFQLNEERKLLWMTFTSRRSYGLRGSKVLLWMVGIEPSALSAGKDPSFTAFALPFQDLESANHIGQWTSKIPASE